MPRTPEVRLDGGRAGGAVRVGDTVCRASGPWTPAVHALLSHLAGQKFAGSPRPLGTDRQGREMLTFLAVTREGFTEFGRRPQRLRRFLDEYGWTANAAGFLDVVCGRVRTHAATIRRLAAAGDPVFTRMVERGDVGSLDVALAELDQIRA
jgi:hypothetical protein